MNDSFYVTQSTPGEVRETFSSSPHTASPWGPASQHGGPPGALLARALERLESPTPRVVGRLALDLLGPVPVGRVSVEAAVVRPGRSVDLCQATLFDEDRGRAVARAQAWRFPAGRPSEAGPAPTGDPPAHGPEDGEQQTRPATWSGGYLDAVEWRWVKGAMAEAGPGVVWMRPRLDLVDGEPMSPLQRLVTCADSASGVSAELDIATWDFLNTELTVHVLRAPVGDWVCLDAETTLGPGSVALATSAVYDRHGLVARTAQTLLTAPRRRPG